jgi:hypothetical protein
MSAAPVNPFLSEHVSLDGEHISLQSDTVEAGARPVHRKPIVKYQLRSRARGSHTRVSILEGHFVGVHVKRGRNFEHEHTVDLRFVDPRPIGIRKIVWPWMIAAILMTLLTIGAAFFVTVLATPQSRILAVPAAIVIGTLTLSSYLICLYFATESVVFVSMHGRARLIVITGGLGTTRAARQCALDIVKHINLARKQGKQTRQMFLRDEMREHGRLHEAGVLSEDQYSDAKKRILQAHD